MMISSQSWVLTNAQTSSTVGPVEPLGGIDDTDLPLDRVRSCQRAGQGTVGWCAMSPVFDCSSEGTRHEGVARAVEALRDGRLVVLPTDTLYGIGADAFNADAVAALLAAKGRGRHMPPPVLVGDVRTVDGLAVDIPAYVRDLMAAFWPGPLTIVLKAQPSLAWDLGDTNGTVALRMPDHDLALEVLREVGPMAVSSANVTGWPASRTMVEAATQLGAAVLVYLDGGPVSGGLASTIVDCTTDDPVILREGALATEDLEPYFPTHPSASASDPAPDTDTVTETDSAPKTDPTDETPATETPATETPTPETPAPETPTPETPERPTDDE